MKIDWYDTILHAEQVVNLLYQDRRRFRQDTLEYATPGKDGKLKENVEAWVALENDRVIGYTTIVLDEYGIGRDCLTIVLDNYKCCGVGTELMKHKRANTTARFILTKISSDNIPSLRAAISARYSISDIGVYEDNGKVWLEFMG